MVALRTTSFAKYSQKMARLASITADHPVPTLMSSPPTFSVGSGTNFQIISGVTHAVNGANVGYVGSTLTQLASATAFYSGRRALGKFRAYFAAEKIEFRLKRTGGNPGFGLLFDGQLAFDGFTGEALAGLLEGADQYVMADFGANTVSYRLARPALASGGTGYAIGDVLTLSGGTFTTAATLRVTSVASGVINAFEIANRGAYSVYPTGTHATTGGTGTGATFTTFWEQTHSTIKPRRVEVVLADTCYLAGIRVGQGASGVSRTLSKWAVSPTAPKVMVVGDSFLQGAYGANPAMNWAWQLAYRLGLEENFCPDGLSGSGYTATNGMPALIDRVADIVAEAPDVIALALGANDEASSVSAATLQAAVTAAIDAIHAALPNALVIAQSGWYGGYGTYRDAINAGVAAVSDQRRARVVNLYEREIYTATTGSHAYGRADIFQVLPTNIHPGQSGMDYLAAMLAPAYAEAISSMAYSILS